MRCTSSDWDGADPQHGVANLARSARSNATPRARQFPALNAHR